MSTTRTRTAPSARTSSSTAPPSSTTSPSGCASRRSPATRPTPTTYAAVRRVARARPRATTGFPTVEVWETRGLPGGLRRVAQRRPGRADRRSSTATTTCSPSTRWDGWEHPPVRADRRRRPAATPAAPPTTRARSRSTPSASARTSPRPAATAPAVNLKLLVEGEEESGSPHFAALLRGARRPARRDVVVVSDTGMWSPRHPDRVHRHARPDRRARSTSTAPTRTCTPARSAARSPTRLPSCRPAGRRAARRPTRAWPIPGFYDGVVELTDDERALFAEAALRRGGAGWRTRAVARDATARPGYTTLERVWARPTAEVNGIWRRLHRAPGSKTIVPSDGHAEAVLPAGRRPGPGARRSGRSRLARRPASRPASGTRSPVGRHAPCLTPLDHPALQSVVRAMGRGLRQRGPLHPRGRLRPRGRPAGRPRRAGALPRHLRARPTAGTRPTRRSSSTCCSRAPRPPPTCGATSPRTDVA